MKNVRGYETYSEHFSPSLMYVQIQEMPHRASIYKMIQLDVLDIGVESSLIHWNLPPVWDVCALPQSVV